MAALLSEGEAQSMRQAVRGAAELRAELAASREIAAAAREMQMELRLQLQSARDEVLSERAGSSEAIHAQDSAVRALRHLTVTEAALRSDLSAAQQEAKQLRAQAAEAAAEAAAATAIAEVTLAVAQAQAQNAAAAASMQLAASEDALAASEAQLLLLTEQAPATPTHPPAPPSTPFAGNVAANGGEGGAVGLEWLHRAVADLTPRAHLAETLAASVGMLQDELGRTREEADTEIARMAVSHAAALDASAAEWVRLLQEQEAAHAREGMTREQQLAELLNRLAHAEAAGAPPAARMLSGGEGWADGEAEEGAAGRMSAAGFSSEPNGVFEAFGAAPPHVARVRSAGPLAAAVLAVAAANAPQQAEEEEGGEGIAADGTPVKGWRGSMGEAGERGEGAAATQLSAAKASAAVAEGAREVALEEAKHLREQGEGMQRRLAEVEAAHATAQAQLGEAREEAAALHTALLETEARYEADARRRALGSALDADLASTRARASAQLELLRARAEELATAAQEEAQADAGVRLNFRDGAGAHALPNGGGGFEVHHAGGRGGSLGAERAAARLCAQLEGVEERARVELMVCRERASLVDALHNEIAALDETGRRHRLLEVELERLRNDPETPTDGELEAVAQQLNALVGRREELSQLRFGLGAQREALHFELERAGGEDRELRAQLEVLREAEGRVLALADRLDAARDCGRRCAALRGELEEESSLLRRERQKLGTSHRSLLQLQSEAAQADTVRTARASVVAQASAARSLRAMALLLPARRLGGGGAAGSGAVMIELTPAPYGGGGGLDGGAAEWGEWGVGTPETHRRTGGRGEASLVHPLLAEAMEMEASAADLECVRVSLESERAALRARGSLLDALHADVAALRFEAVEDARNHGNLHFGNGSGSELVPYANGFSNGRASLGGNADLRLVRELESARREVAVAHAQRHADAAGARALLERARAERDEMAAELDWRVSALRAKAEASEELAAHLAAARMAAHEAEVAADSLLAERDAVVEELQAALDALNDARRQLRLSEAAAIEMHRADAVAREANVAAEFDAQRVRDEAERHAQHAHGQGEVEALRMQADLVRLLQDELDAQRAATQPQEGTPAPPGGQDGEGAAAGAQVRAAQGGALQAELSSLRANAHSLQLVEGNLAALEAENAKLRTRAVELADARARLMDELERAEAEAESAAALNASRDAQILTLRGQVSHLEADLADSRAGAPPTTPTPEVVPAKRSGFFGGSASATKGNQPRPRTPDQSRMSLEPQTQSAAERLARERLREAELALETQQRMYKAHIADLASEIDSAATGSTVLGGALAELDGELARKEDRLRSLRADLDELTQLLARS
ncbi:hypothetical protein T492DRAFT_1051604 [Pavlovales sp. CCMP2436]|nr:hypothetical protein T492DRAFT_1051604 [Pavlovales sp. CCMP2436]